MPGDFLFAVCQLGAEAAVKHEVAREHPELRPAYSRPGLLTFKGGAGVALRSVFARVYGESIGPAQDVAAVGAAARTLAGRLRLHVWERDDDEGARAAAVRQAIVAGDPDRFIPGEVARGGELVLDVVLGPEAEPWWLGCHRHGAGHSPYPGGRIPVRVPPEAPSRAYRKLIEALDWSRAALRRGEVAVEVGSAPGGASYALLRRGLEVVGIDPGAMDPRVLAHPGFRHVAKAVGEARREDLPRRAQWLLLDVNLAPQVALHAVRRLVAMLRPGLRGVLFTLKLNDWGMAAEVPALLARVAAMGLVEVRATQLPSNRQEICVFGIKPGRAGKAPFSL